MKSIPDMDAGIQPLDLLMQAQSLRNHDLVEASTENLTHKQVQKARQGRKITFRMQKKILLAWNSLQEEAFVLEQLFNYRGR
ncbi:MAG: hypothetical protein MK183_09675 [Verrucomicrobiales bacterium]|jgi:hypothetical protein|nr:hypothetical protein [Verrucomicrobiales bacterium]MED5587079.1 hypothetical protein [Verrucomicrobiota bacterium]